MRLYVAAEIPQTLRETLAALQRRLRDQVPGARWAPVAGMHLTFKFIGETPEARVPALQAALRGALPSPALSSFSLRVEGLGVFPDRRRPRVLWAGMTPSPAGMPQAAHQVIDEALHVAGCPRDDRPFHPHLTLARMGERGGGADLAGLVAAAADEEYGSFDVSTVCLFQSILRPPAAEHRRLEEYRLA